MTDQNQLYEACKEASHSLKFNILIKQVFTEKKMYDI